MEESNKRSLGSRNYDALERRGLMLPSFAFTYKSIELFMTLLSSMFDTQVSTRWGSMSTAEREQAILVANPTIPKERPSTPTQPGIVPEVCVSYLSAPGALEKLVASLIPEGDEEAGAAAYRVFMDSVEHCMRRGTDVAASLGYTAEKPGEFFMYFNDSFYIINDRKRFFADDSEGGRRVRESLVPASVARKSFFRLKFLYQVILTVVADLRDGMELKPPQAAKGACTFCAQAMVKRMTCARCRIVSYCGKECQHAHWKEHRGDCVDWGQFSAIAELLPQAVTFGDRSITLADAFLSRLDFDEMSVLTPKQLELWKLAAKVYNGDCSLLPDHIMAVTKKVN